MTEHANLVGGRPHRTTDGRREVRAACAPFEPLGTFPVSGPAAVQEALEVLRAAPWQARPWAERVRLLERAARALGEAEHGAVARRLGLDLEELAPHAVRSAGIGGGIPAGPENGGDGGPGGPGGPGGNGGIALVAPDWSELFCGTWHSVALELARGRAVLLCADPRVPHVAEEIVRALLAAGVPDEALALLHGATEEALDAALADPSVTSVRASGPAPRIARLRRAAEAGRHEAALLVPSSSACELAPDADLAAAAADVVERAFGRSRALFGQLPGHVARVFVPERLFSRFTDLLLERLEASEPWRRPLPLIDAEALARVRTAWALGLDEGATLIAGGGVPGVAPGPPAPGDRPEALAAGDELPASGAAGEAAGGAGPRDLRVLPTVFTNVELDMDLARRPEPQPVLSLLRSRDVPGRPRAAATPGAPRA